MSMNKEQIKGLITEYERYKNGFQRLNGATVRVVNIRARAKVVTADVFLSSDEYDTETRYNNCEYPMEVLEGVQAELDAWEAQRTGSNP